MNTDTGKIYRTPEEVSAARQRGEPIVEASPRVAMLMTLAAEAERFAAVADKLIGGNRKERRRQAAMARKAKP